MMAQTLEQSPSTPWQSKEVRLLCAHASFIVTFNVVARGHGEIKNVMTPK